MGLNHMEAEAANKRFAIDRIMRKAEAGELDMRVEEEHIGVIGNDEAQYRLHFKPNNSPAPFYDDLIQVERFSKTKLMGEKELAHQAAWSHLNTIKKDIQRTMGTKAGGYRFIISHPNDKELNLKVEKKETEKKNVF